MRILIVEDEKRLAGTLAELLHRQGYAVDVSYDGVSGLDNARSGIYDLVLLDACCRDWTASPCCSSSAPAARRCRC